MALLLILSIILIGLGSVVSEISLRFVFIIEIHDHDLSQKIGRALKAVEESRTGVRISDDIVTLDREDEVESYRMLCSSISKGVSTIIDISWSPWELATQLSSDAGVPLIRTSLGSQQLVGAVDQYLESRNATDAAILLETEADVDKTLYHLLGSSNIRVWVHAGFSRDTARALGTMRPDPGFYVIVGSTHFVMNVYARAVKEKLVRRGYRWNLVFTDYPDPGLDLSSLVLPTMLLQPDGVECCKLIARENCSCPNGLQEPVASLTYIPMSHVSKKRNEH